VAGSSLIEAKKLKGFRDYSPAECKVREEIINSVRRTAATAGYLEISTPALEYREVLMGSGGDEADKEVYSFVDHGERAVALRYDLTVPFARYVAEHQGTMFFPFKKLQVGEVWRGEKPQKGRYRQFCQADLDIIGADSIAADVDILLCMKSSLDAVLQVPFTYAIGNRVILSHLIRSTLRTQDQAAEFKALIAIDKLKKLGREVVTEIISKIDGVQAQDASQLVALIESQAHEFDRDKIMSFAAESEPVQRETQRYCQTIDMLTNLAKSGTGIGKFRADLSLARGLGYYTGIVFEGTIDSLPGLGSISGGGRYNQLVSRFSSRELAGVGGSVGVDRILAAFEEMGISESANRQGVFVAVATEDALGYGFSILLELRRNGVLADIGMQPGKLGNQFKHADRLKFSRVITVGTDEFMKKQFALKDLATGTEQKGLAFAEVARLAT
jgi:histidyl-tRNA synthetase